MTFVRPLSQGATRCEHVLLDTRNPADAWSTGRPGPECWDRGSGLMMMFDGTGQLPCVAMYAADAEISLRGIREIRTFAQRMDHALRLAEAFGPPLSLDDWRRLHAPD